MKINSKKSSIKSLYFLSFVLIIFSIPVYKYSLYWLLVNKLGIAYSYFIDQFLSFFLACLLGFFIIRKYIPLTTLKIYLVKNLIPILIIVISCLIVHGWILGNYFFGEEPSSVLYDINQGDKIGPVSGVSRGWFLGIYILSYKLFYTNVIWYNVVSLITYSITTIILYIFLNQLFNKRVLPALVATLFFITTPSYMDLFSWQMSSSGATIALSAGILSLIFLLAYHKNLVAGYYLLSLLFYLAMLKIGFTRMFAFIGPILFICLFVNSLNVNRYSIKRFVFLGFPYICVLFCYLLIVFILPNLSLRLEHIVTVRSQPLNYENYSVALSMFIAYLFIPSQFAEQYYPRIKLLLGSTNASITVLFGYLLIAFLFSICFLALRNRDKRWGLFAIFSIVTIFANLVFVPLMVQGYNIPAEVDTRFMQTGAGNGPGMRYLFVPAMGLSMLVGTLFYWVIVNKKKYLRSLLIFTAIILVFHSYLNIKSHQSFLRDIHPSQTVVPNGFFAMIPTDDRYKLVYSANPEKNSIDNKFGNWLYAFYKVKELKYSNSPKEIKKLIDTGKYERSNFYAFYNNTYTQSFKDISNLAREELYDGNLDKSPIHLINSVNLSPTLINTGDPTLPYILQRSMYVSENLNYRFVLPKSLSFNVEKRRTLNIFPYIDAYKVKPNEKWQGSTFPINVWDMLKNKPVFVEDELRLALDFSSLRGGMVDELTPETRIKIAQEMLRRDMNKDDEISLSGEEQTNKHYIDNEKLLNILLKSRNFNSMALIYACAEDSDWEKQNQSEEQIGGVWYVKEFPLNTKPDTEQLNTSITCYGSVLRKIILVGPPYSVELKVSELKL